MRRDRAILPTLVALAMLFSVAPPAHADDVNLSRNRLTAFMPPQISFTEVFVFQPVDPLRISEFCDDGDGCTVHLQMVHGSGDMRGDERVLFKNNNRWMSAGEAASHVDGDLDEVTIMFQAIGGDSCSFSDVDPSGSDDSDGFSVVAFYNGGAGVTPGFLCELTLMD